MEVDLPSFEGVGSGVDALAGMSTGKSAGRRDGRSPNEMRQLSISQGSVSRADGSARVTMSGTDVLVAVYGPMDCPIAKQNAEKLHVHISYRRREGCGSGGVTEGGVDGGGGQEAEATRNLRLMVCEIVLAALHPRKAAVVAIHVLADNGSVSAATANATVVALIDAGMPMQSVPCAASVSIANQALVVDPVKVEELEADAVITACFDSSAASDGFMSVYTQGDCGGDSLFTAAVETCRQLACKTRTFMRICLEKKAEHPFVWSSV